MSAPSNQPATGDARRLGQAELERLRRTIISHFASHLYHQVGLREICRDAQVSPKTVYKYFGSKEELMLACVEPDLEELLRHTRVAVEGATGRREALWAVARCQFAFYAERPAVARVVFLNLPEAYWMEQRSPAELAREVLVNELLAAAAPERRRGEAALVIDVSAGAVRRLVVRWLIEGQTHDLRARGEAFLSLMEGVVDG